MVKPSRSNRQSRPGCFDLETDFFLKDETVRLMQEWGSDGVVAILRVWCAMLRKTSGTLPEATVYALHLGTGINPEKWSGIIKWALLPEISWLTLEDGVISNKRIAADRAKYTEVCEKNQKNAIAGWAAKHGMRLVPITPATGKPVASDSHANGIPVVSEKRHSESIPQVVSDATRMPSASESLTITLKDLDSNISKKEEVSSVPPGHGEPQVDNDSDKELERHLCQVTDPDAGSWINSNPYILEGRRPLRKYPQIHLTRSQLANVVQSYLENGIPKDRLRLAFLKAQARLGVDTTGDKNAYSWLLGWCQREVLDELTCSKRLQNTGGAP